jgi:hypothetical protein
MAKFSAVIIATVALIAGVQAACEVPIRQVPHCGAYLINLGCKFVFTWRARTDLAPELTQLMKESTTVRRYRSPS